MAILLVAPILWCLSLAVVTAVLRAPALARVAGIAASLGVLAAGVGLAWASLHGQIPTALGGVLRGDALSAFMVAVVGAVGLVSTWGGLSRAKPPTWGFATLVALFLGAMNLAVVADNLGVLWVAIEATTITTAFLVGHQRKRSSLEAAWKYVVLGSVGVAIALLGIVLIFAATHDAGVPTLSWVAISQGNMALDPGLMRMAGALAVLGFATKAGLAPMHSWLPDAHSQAPAPVSGLMSGVLLSVAFYAILRVQSIVNPVIGSGLMRGLLTVAGLLSLLVAAMLILRQRDLKRMLAYSSIEHMGLLALAAAIGSTLAITAALLHILGHGLAKSSLFVVSGRILAVEGTTAMAGIRSLFSRRPGVAVPFLIGMAALLGLPPFSLFFSEVGIVLAGFQERMGIVTGIAVVALLVLFAGLARNTAVMMFGPVEQRIAESVELPALVGAGGVSGEPMGRPLVAAVAFSQGDEAVDRSPHGPMIPIFLAFIVAAVIGFGVGPFATLLQQAAGVLWGIR